ncbi:MAG TPA: bacillithiol system redox-active protein YtxJ [Bacillaceae bacterium]
MNAFKELTSSNDWKNVMAQSMKEPILVFKHSTTCPISASAYQEYISFETELDKYVVKVIESRPVSNEIANDIGVTHQSPQIFLIKEEKPLWNASHWHITEKSIEEAIKENLS